MRGSSTPKGRDMPFIINGQKLNKPIYEGVVLNAIHVWLQNHWTGAANASTSTLSQDGTVVATNLAPNAKPVSSGFIGFNYTALIFTLYS